MVLFVILNLINVILGTMRSILTVKASPTVAVLINTLSYTFYAGIVKMTSGQSMAIVLITTALTNIVGVYIAKWLISLSRKDKLWVIDVTTSKFNKFDMSRDLSALKIQHSIFDIVNSNLVSFRLYSYTQRDSQKIKKVLKFYDVKYNIVETKGTL